MMDYITVSVFLDAAPPTPADFAISMMSADHGFWRAIWPGTRERWRWLYWLARTVRTSGLAPRLMSSPRFAYAGCSVQIGGPAMTRDLIVHHYCHLHGLCLDGSGVEAAPCEVTRDR